MVTNVTLATCSLNQWALDFEGNKQRIVESVRRAKSMGARYRLGPELEVCGYGCNDHFYEADTFEHSWEVVASLLADERLYDIIMDVGAPIVHKSVKYNCRIWCYNGKILFIRPKLYLANDGNYREGRWFTPWLRPRYMEEHTLPARLRKVTHQETVPFGDVVLETLDTCLASEICEELFTPNSPHVHLGLDGVEIFTNGSASHHELRKLQRRVDLMRSATSKIGGAYLYANQQGCDGERMYYDGCALVVCNGDVLAQGSQFSLDDIEVVVASVCLDDIRSRRGSVISRGMQATVAPLYHRVKLPISLSDPFVFKLSHPMTPLFHSVEEEIELGPACWLWDYLRRSNMNGFLLPLSGGIDSGATAVTVASMCRLVAKRALENDPIVLRDARRVAGLSETDSYIPKDPKEFANRIFHTCYMRTSNSSDATRRRAKGLAEAIGSYHVDMDMSDILNSILQTFATLTGKTPRYRVNSGSSAENLALQNVQARLRMLLGYLMAQLLLWVRGRQGALLVLGSANVDECLRGYFTKYDCSSADLNPIGSISKHDLRLFIQHAAVTYPLPILQSFLEAEPTAELEPITSTYVQQDEKDMGMTYDDLSVYGRLRKVYRCGPVSMFTKLLAEWSPSLSPSDIAERVKRFFHFYAINRHKMTTLTPAYHCESYSPDDHRFDLRPFLYPPWTWQFQRIDHLLASFLQQQRDKEQAT